MGFIKLPAGIKLFTLFAVLSLTCQLVKLIGWNDATRDLIAAIVAFVVSILLIY